MEWKLNNLQIHLESSGMQTMFCVEAFIFYHNFFYYENPPHFLRVTENKSKVSLPVLATVCVSADRSWNARGEEM